MTGASNDDWLPDPTGRSVLQQASRRLAAEVAAAPVVARPAPAPEPPQEPPAQGRPRGQIFEGCPVVPLGVLGDWSYYLDVLGQLRAVDNHTAQKIQHVFGGRIALLERFAPSFDKEGIPRKGKFDQMRAASVMTAACAERGVWEPTGSVRGPGAWIDEDGGLVYHAGDDVMIGGSWRKPGVYDGKVYPAARPIPRPSPVAGAGDAALELHELIATWRWRRPDTDPMLALGAIAAQMLGGALDWRPVTWITGDMASGKSTFQDLLKYVHGGEQGLLQAADATEAGIRSVVGYSSLPVAIDEAEPDPTRPQKMRAVIELARRAASGGQIFRGGADQKGHQSNAVSAFLFSSILVPDMPAQDRSRLILLELDQPAPGAPKPIRDPRRWRRWGERVRGALVQGWPTWPERLDLWRAALAAAGITGRGGDNYATVLGLADMALHTGLPDADYLDAWASKIARFWRDEQAEVGSNAEDMVLHLLGRELDVYRRGRKVTVGDWVAMAARLPGAPEELDGTMWSAVNGLIAQYGLRVRYRGERAELAIATRSAIEGLARLFEGSPWANGVWGQAAARIKGAEPANLTFARVPSRAWYVPLRAIPGIFRLPADANSAAHEAAPGPDDMEGFA